MVAHETPDPEITGPYINAPVWPWTLAGWVLAASVVLLFIVAWIRS
jgi:hypothetical protein